MKGIAGGGSLALSLGTVKTIGEEGAGGSARGGGAAAVRSEEFIEGGMFITSWVAVLPETRSVLRGSPFI
jgi:hypothetical protein